MVDNGNTKTVLFSVDKAGLVFRLQKASVWLLLKMTRNTEYRHAKQIN